MTPAFPRSPIPTRPPASSATCGATPTTFAASTKLPASPRKPKQTAGPAHAAAASDSSKASAAAGRTVLTELESKQILSLYGIPTVETRVARSPAEAGLIARAIGFPVAMKLHSETVTHKTDVGGVKLNLADEDRRPPRLQRNRSLRARKGGRRRIPRRHRPAHDSHRRLRTHPRQQHRSAVRPGNFVRFRRATRRSLPRPRPGPAAAQHHSGAAPHGADPRLSRLAGCSRPRTRRPRNSENHSRSLQQARHRAALDQGNRHQPAARVARNESSPSTRA